ncbi:hypothetical protein KIN20_003209 [Parelaphostrongylus tenuis]|uniref:Uncharacterized protein n=1 Tax=Parelaphostrongylus tenuis TaxID=148309 RepID=A0AAD5MHX9_PARTN|nr:hypothetical protein KIN20_003209 [Parelaphostrongylus tenuis]
MVTQRKLHVDRLAKRKSAEVVGFDIEPSHADRYWATTKATTRTADCEHRHWRRRNTSKRRRSILDLLQQ